MSRKEDAKCRVCASSFYNETLVYINMPKAAQNFPSKDSIHKEKGNVLDIRQCSACGLVPYVGEPVEYYRDVIRATGVSQEMAVFRQEQFARLNQQYKFAEKRIIEIGSGHGEYLKLMSESKWNVCGIEHEPNAVKACLKDGLIVEEGYLESSNYSLKNAPFDAFVCFNFLEHIPDLKSFLKAISNNIKTGGIGLIEVPNFDMMVKESMSTEFIADHLYYFTKNTLKRTLEMNGFDVLEIDVIWHDYIISAVVKKRSNLSFDNFKKQDEILRKNLENYLNLYKDKRVAIWGAGHQALATIAMSGIAKKIEYVIDSAPFKQNKYTPATHLPIVAPSILESKPVDTIIIMAAAYSDEIATYIKQHYGTKIGVAILRTSWIEILI